MGRELIVTSAVPLWKSERSSPITVPFSQIGRAAL
jgi:hypothetical protein